MSISEILVLKGTARDVDLKTVGRAGRAVAYQVSSGGTNRFPNEAKSSKFVECFVLCESGSALDHMTCRLKSVRARGGTEMATNQSCSKSRVELIIY